MSTAGRNCWLCSAADVLHDPKELQDTDAQVEFERLTHYFQHSVRALPGSIYPAMAIWVWFYWETRSINCLIWAAMVHTWQALRLHISWQSPVWRRPLPGMQQAERESVQQLALFAVAWGLAPWMLMPGNDHAHLSIIVLMMVGTMSGSAAGLAYSMQAGLTYLAVVGAMLMAWMLWQRTLVDTVLAISMSVYTVSLMILFRNQNRTLVQVIRSRIALREQSQRLATQNEELDRLQQERSRLFATASHDLRQPVQSLSLQAETLRQTLAGTPQADAACRIGDVTQSLSRSLDSILDLYQLEAPSRHAANQWLSVEQLLFDASQMWNDIASRRGLSLRFHGMALWVHAPRVTVQRLLHNLIDNALKFTREGGVLVAVRLRRRASGPWARLEVWDTGVGVSPADQERLFEAFFRATLPQDMLSPQGLGLGLSAIRRICDERGWASGMRSTVGKGSVFWLEIPCTENRPIETDPT